MIRLFTIRAAIATLKRVLAFSRNLQPRMWVSLAVIQAVLATLYLWGYQQQPEQHPIGEMTDVFAFVDPANPNNVVLILPVDPFQNPGGLPSSHFSEGLLYQMKIDNGGTPAEDLVIQIEFHGGHASQSYDVTIGTPSVVGPHGNMRLTGGATLCHGNKVYLGRAANTGLEQSFIVPNGPNSGTVMPGVQCFAGVADDSFWIDVAHRAGLNPNENLNATSHTQDVFREGVSTSFNPLRGRQLRANGTSSVDGSGSYDIASIIVSLPKNMLRGIDVRGVSLAGSTRPLAMCSLIGVWGMVSRPTSESFDGFTITHSTIYEQFERMGQLLANTVYIFSQPTQWFTALTHAEAGVPIPPGGTSTLSDSKIKDFFNSVGPETDGQFFNRYIPDSLTTVNTTGDTSLSGNTIAGRAAGFTTPAFGTPLVLPEAGLTGNLNRAFLRKLIFPDYMHLNLDQATDGVRRGGGPLNDSLATFAVDKRGLQSGLRSDLMGDWFRWLLPQFQPPFISQSPAAVNTPMLDMLLKLALLFQAIIFSIGSVFATAFAVVSYLRGQADLKLKQLQIREMEIKLENMDRERDWARQEAMRSSIILLS